MGGQAYSPTLRSFSKEGAQIGKADQQQINRFEAFGGPQGSDPLLAGASQFAESLMGAGEGDILATIQGHGALTPWQERDVATGTQAAEAQMGMGHSDVTLGQRLMNRYNVQQQNLNQAYSRAGSILQPSLATNQAATQSYTALTNPILSYLSNLFDFNANAQNAASIAGANKTSGLEAAGISSIGSIAGAAIGASDRRMKTDIRETGEETPEGIPITTYRFKGDRTRRTGVIAQDVERLRPDAVIRTASGRLLVDYGKLLNGRAA